MIDLQQEITENWPSRNNIREALKAWDRTDTLGELPLSMSVMVVSQRQEHGYSDSPSGRGLALREVLNAVIESMLPDSSNENTNVEQVVDPADKRARAYFILRERFIMGRNLAWIAAQLHISQRTCQYEQTRALDLLADNLRQQELRTRQQVDKHQETSPLFSDRTLSNLSTDAPTLSGEEKAPATFFAPPRPHHPLIGRQTLVDQLRQRFATTDGGTLVALHGLPGVGKSALAIELAHDPTLLEHFAGGVLWIGLGPKPDVAALLAIWGRALGISSNELSARPNAADRARLVHSAIGMRQSLLIIDDAWSMNDAVAFKVGGPNCSYLLTTRFADVAFDFAGDGAQPLDELDGERGLALLETLAPSAVASEPATMRNLADAVGGLPLALTLMGKQLGRVALKAQPRRLRHTLEQLQTVEARFNLTEPHSPMTHYPDLSPSTPRSLAAAINLSVATLDRDTQQALRSLALFPAKPNTFSEEAALQSASIGVETLDLLVDVALIESMGQERYTLHQTIADYARLMADAFPPHEEFVAYFVTFTHHWRKHPKELGKELENIQAALDLAYNADMLETAIAGTLALAPFLTEFGYLAQAEAYLVRAKEASVTLAAPILEMNALLQLGITRCHLGQYHNAQTHLTQSLELAYAAAAQTVLADNHLALGIVYNRLGVTDQSKEHLVQALHLFHTLTDQSGEMRTLTELGTLMLRQSSYPQAATYFAEARAIAQSAEDRQGEMAALTGLGETAKNQANFKVARGYHEEALAICRNLNNRFAEGKIAHGLANVLLSLGDSEAAENYYLQNLRIFREVGARADESRTLNNLGLIKMNLGDYAQAAAHFEGAIAIDDETGSQYAKGVALHNLARTYLLQGQYMRVAPYYQQALQIAQSINDRESEARTLRNLGLMHLYCGDYASALTHFTKALTIIAEIDNPLGRTRTLRYLGLQAYSVGNHQQALDYGLEALAIAEEKGHPTEQGDGLTLIGHARWALGQLDAAAAAYQQAFQIRQTLGERHLAIESLAGLAGVEQARGAIDVAKQHADEICAHLAKDPALTGTVAPFQIYRICYQILSVTDFDAAKTLLTAAHELLMARANQFPPEQRTIYLENIDPHRKILAEMASLDA